MSPIRDLVSIISQDARCVVHPHSGTTAATAVQNAPDDVREFYDLCDGIELFPDSEYPYRIVRSSEFVNISQDIYEPCMCDDQSISDEWFLIAESWNTDPISIDLSVERQGMCCDCYLGSDFHVISPSFYELLKGLYENAGGYHFWLEEGVEYSDPCRFSRSQS